MRGAQGDSCGATEVRSPWTWRGGAPHCSRVMVGESSLKTLRRRTLEVFLGVWQETLGTACNPSSKDWPKFCMFVCVCGIFEELLNTEEVKEIGFKNKHHLIGFPQCEFVHSCLYKGMC